MKKKILSVLLALCSLLTAVGGITVSALSDSDREELEARIIDACRYNQETDISDFELTADELNSVYQSLQSRGKLPWYAWNRFSYTYQDVLDQTTLTTFIPEVMHESYDRMAYEQKVAEILAQVPQEGMADWQIALVIHDYLVLHCVYDESLQKKTGYDLLIEGTTVCAGYASVYQDLLTRLGIPCLQVTSEAMDHAWNLVQIDGAWYHVDVTWDDPVKDVEGRVKHTYFLKTDREMKEAERSHHGWVGGETCNDSRFSDGFWTDVDTAVIFTDADTCYYLRSEQNRNSLYRRKVAEETESRLWQEPDEYLKIKGDLVRYEHSGLALRDGRLWVTAVDRVLSLDTNGKNQKTEFTYNTEKNQKWMIGAYPQNDRLAVTLLDTDDNYSLTEQELSPVDGHVHSYTYSEVAASCATEGYTLAVCSCGIQARGNVKAPDAHAWKEHEGKTATFWEDGYSDRECTICGKRETVTLRRLKFLPWVGQNKKPIAIGLGCLLVLWVLISLLSGKRKRKRR